VAAFFSVNTTELLISFCSGFVHPPLGKIPPTPLLEIFMNRFAIACFLATSAAAFTSVQAEVFHDNARVRSVDPQYEQVTVPREQCSTQWVNETHRVNDSRPHYGGVIIGGVAGGVVGNQVGRGSGRDAATAIGAVVGAIVGDQVARNHGRNERVETTPRQVTQCQAVNEVQTRIAGYRVTYDYRGQTFTTLMRQQPGANLQVRVSVDPVIQ
jgi:uncharacterized protein YcfJ